MAGPVVYDSDEDSDLSPPPRSPVRPVHGLMDRPATPPRAMVAHMEPSPLPETLGVTHPVATSSTDPSFFQNVYEEQQRELGAQLGTERDLWDVPSSPMRPPRAMQPSDSTKRKREAEIRESNASTSAGNAPSKRQRQEGDTARPVMSSGLEISIPLEPMTPSMLHQYPRLLSSSIDQSFPGEVTHTLGHALPALHHEYQQPPGDAVTQSTVAFATPSMYASSGRRGLGSSNNANAGNDTGCLDMTGNNKSSFDGRGTVEEVATRNTSTPPRKARAATIQQIMSSPDIIAGPAPQSEPEPQRYPIAPAEAHKEDADADADAEDELCINARPSARDEIDESDGDGSELSFHSSPGRGAVHTPSPAKKKAKKIVIIKRPAVIAASDDDDFDSSGEDDLAGGDGYHDVPCAPAPASDTDSDFSVKAAKKSKKAAPKAKKGRKKDAAIAEAQPTKSNEVIHIELPDQAPIADQAPPQPKGKRARGRPKQVAKKEYKDSDDELDHVLSGSEAERPQLPAVESAVKPAAKAIAKTTTTTKTTAKPKGKKGRGKQADSKVKTIDDDDDELSASVTALSETSGNAVSADPIRIPEKEEDNKNGPGAEEDKPAAHAPIATPTAKEKTPVSPVVKPSASGRTTGLGIGLGATGQARVLYRVGLSKKTRIAPLLKIVRK